jgi:hypothetical protein
MREIHMIGKIGALVVLVVMAACASSSGRASAEQAVVFSDTTVPGCAFEVVQDITATVSIQGEREAAEEALHRALARRAERHGADGVIGVSIQAPGPVPVAVSGGQRPTEADLPAVRWNASAQAIRFLDSACRS